MIFARTINKIPEFYVISAQKMPKLYIIIARKIFFPEFWGARAPSVPPVSYAYAHPPRSPIWLGPWCVFFEKLQGACQTNKLAW